ncbi:MAG: hypothetical protein AAFU70_06885, partial [Planctomycetota bacterium]
MTVRSLFGISVIAGLGACVSAGAQTPFDLIGADLSRSPIRLVELTPSEVVWADASDDTAMLPLDSALGIVARGVGQSDSSDLGVLRALTFEPSVLTLTDGRRLTGSLSAQADLPEVLRWQHAVLGTVDVPLEQIDRLVLQRATIGGGSTDPLPPSDRSDVVLLRNGDRLEGFVVDLGRDAVIEVDGREVVVPMESVHQLALANPREAWDGPMVWLRDGSVLGASEVLFDGGLFVLVDEEAELTEAEGLSATIRPENIEAVSFDTRRLVPVSRLVEDAEPSTAGVFGARAIELAGEDSVRVDLPDGATRLVLTAELPLRARAW